MQSREKLVKTGELNREDEDNAPPDNVNVEAGAMGLEAPNVEPDGTIKEDAVAED